MACRFWICMLLASVGIASAGDGVRMRDHWTRLGLTATEIELIDQMDLSKSKVEGLIQRGVSVREYARRPWEPMGLTEAQWIKRLDQGTDIGALERFYDREGDLPSKASGADGDENGIQEKPNLALAFFLPGYCQIKTGRPVTGWVMAGLGTSFAVLTVAKREPDGSINPTWPLLLGATMFASAADIWYHHYREQAVSGYSWQVVPTFGNGAGLAAWGRF